MAKIIEFKGDDLSCDCGNKPSLDGFFPCTATGELCEPVGTWEGHYKCASCGQIYLWEGQ